MRGARRESPPVAIGRWRVWLAQGQGTASAGAWVELVERLVTCDGALHSSKHAETYRAAAPAEGGEVYVKVYRRYRRRTDLKDTLRISKARHVRRVSTLLEAAGFCVPRVVAAAERRSGPFLSGAWMVTRALAGEPIADRLALLSGERPRPEGIRDRPRQRDGAIAADPERAGLAAKRALLGALGAEVARLHVSGFVAGDLVPANVWVVPSANASRIAFLDHDRTTAGQRPAPWRRQRRNLVQLNRVVLAGVSASDRLRVYRSYAAGRGWSWRAARRRLPWIITKTAARRRRFAARRQSR